MQLFIFLISKQDKRNFYGEQLEENYTISFIEDEEGVLIEVITGSEEENFYLFGDSVDSLEVVTPMNEANFSYVNSDSEGLFFITNYRAPKYRLVKILFDDFSMAEVIPESNLTLKEASFVNDMIIADYIDINMHSKIIF